MGEKEVSLERIDERVRQLDHRVGRFERQVETRFDGVESSLGELHSDFRGLQRTLIQVAWALSIGLLGLLVTLIGVIVTKF